MRFLLLLTGFCMANAMGPVPRTPEIVLKSIAAAHPGNLAASACNDVYFQSCQYNFNTALGIPGNADWHQPYLLQNALFDLYIRYSQSGIVAVCNAYQGFYQCLGTQYTTCVNPLHFLSEGYSLATAYFYPALMAQLHFQCGAGLNTFLANFQCIAQTYVQFNATLQMCQTTYANNILANPSQACQYATTLLSCTRAPFLSTCNVPTSWYSCEYARVGVAIHLPYCSLRCSVSSSVPGSDKQQGTAPKALSDMKSATIEDAMKKLAAPQLKMFQEIAAHADKVEKGKQKKV